MEFKLSPIGNFMRRSEFTPMTRDEYQATTHPSPLAGQEPEETATKNPRVEVREQLNKIASNYSGATTSTLLRGIVPSESSMGFSNGLYAGVGELSAAKVQSLISQYV